MALSISKGFEENVQLHLTRGIHELASLARCLLQARKDPHKYAEIREHITTASKELAKAEALTEEQLERINSRNMEIMELKSKLTNEQKRRKEELDVSSNDLKELVTLRDTNMKNCVEKKEKKEYAQMEQAFAEQEGERQRCVINAALWTMLVPVVGPLLGGTVAIKARADMKKAEKKAASAKDMVDHFRGKEEKYNHEAKKYIKLLKGQENSIQENKRRMEMIEEEKCKLVKCQEETLGLQETLRRCVHFVGMLASKASVVEITSQYVFVYESLQYQLEDMEKHLLPVLGRKSIGAEGLAILSRPEMKRSVRNLKRFSEPPNVFHCIYQDLEETV